MSKVRLLCVGLLVCGLTGCRHRTSPSIPAVTLAPVALEPMPQPGFPGQIAEAPVPTAPVPTVELPKKKAHRTTRHKPGSVVPAGTLPVAAPAVSAPPPEEVARATPPPPIAAVIGSLTAGEDGSPQNRQHAEDLLASNDRRMKALPKAIITEQHDSVLRVRNFDRDAKTALRSGDAGGALTLGKKAQVLLDDLESSDTPQQ